MRIVAAAALLAVLTGPQAWAQADIDCENAQTQFEMNMCAAQDYQAADDELNAIWKEARARADELDAQFDKEMQGAAAALIGAQRAWINYRDSNCELAGWEAHGGSMEPMVISACLAEMTRARTRELREFVTVLAR